MEIVKINKKKVVAPKFKLNNSLSINIDGVIESFIVTGIGKNALVLQNERVPNKLGERIEIYIK